MAYVKINNTELVNMSTHIQKAFDALDEVEDIWGNKFAQLYADFVESGFLDSLYEDAESNFYQALRAATAIGAASSVFLLIPVGGWIAWVVSVLFGVVAYALQGDPQWLTVSKEAFTQLLRACKEYQDDNYIRISNLATKFYHMQLSIEKLRNKVDTFQSTANQVGATAEQMGLSTRTGGSDDGILLGVETEVVIDGKAVKMDAAEAMSALYTYAYTVTSTMIAADYLERTYGYDIDYLGLVANANAFMADTIQSDLYTPEMIQLILPSFAPDEKAAYSAASAATGLDPNELQAAFGDVASLGVAPLFAGLVGAGFMGKLKDDPSTTAPNSTGPSSTGPSTTGPNTTGPNTTGPNTTGPNTTGPGSQSTGGPGTTTTAPPDPGTSTGTEPGNDVEVDPIIETDVPLDKDIEVELGILDEDGNVDYDKLAMEEYQFDQDLAKIEEERLSIMKDVENKYSSGDFSSLSNALKEFGYTTPQIATILASKSMTINAMLDGNTRSALAARAAEMAKADGVKDYTSKYSTNPSMNELSDTKKPLRSLHLNSDNKKLVDMEKNLDGLEEDYKGKVDAANKLLDEAATEKQAVDAIKEKYEKEYGKDTSKWSESAAKEYDEAIDKYNIKAEKANTAIEEANNAKKSYQTSREEFDKACEDYYKSRIIEEDETNHNASSGSSSDGYVSDTSNVGSSSNSNSSNSNNSGFAVNGDGTVSFGSFLNNSNNANSSASNNSVNTNTNTSSGNDVGAEKALTSFGMKLDKDNN